MCFWFPDWTRCKKMLAYKYDLDQILSLDISNYPRVFLACPRKRDG